MFKRKNDLIVRHADRNKLRGNAIFPSVALNPKATFDDIDMDKDTVSTLVSLPPDIHQKVPIAFAIHNDFATDSAVGVRDCAVLFQETFKFCPPGI